MKVREILENNIKMNLIQQISIIKNKNTMNMMELIEKKTMMEIII